MTLQLRSASTDEDISLSDMDDLSSNLDSISGFSDMSSVDLDDIADDSADSDELRDRFTGNERSTMKKCGTAASLRDVFRDADNPDVMMTQSNKETVSPNRRRTSSRDDSYIDELADMKRKTSIVRVDNYLNDDGSTIDKSDQSLGLKRSKSKRRDKSIRETKRKSSSRRKTEKDGGSDGFEKQRGETKGSAKRRESSRKHRKSKKSDDNERKSIRKSRKSVGRSKKSSKQKGGDEQSNEYKEIESDHDLLAKVESISSTIYATRANKPAAVADRADKEHLSPAAEYNSTVLAPLERSPSKFNMFAKNRITPTPPGSDPSLGLGPTEPPVEAVAQNEAEITKESIAEKAVVVEQQKRVRSPKTSPIRSPASVGSPLLITKDSSFFSKPRQLETQKSTKALQSDEMESKGNESGADIEKEDAMRNPDVFIAFNGEPIGADILNANGETLQSPEQVGTTSELQPPRSAASDSVRSARSGRASNRGISPISSRLSTPTELTRNTVPATSDMHQPSENQDTSERPAPMLEERVMSFIPPSSRICQTIKSVAYFNAVRIAQGAVPKALCASADSTVHIHSIIDGSRFPSLEGHTDRVISLAVSNPFYYMEDEQDVGTVTKPKLRTLVASGSRDQQLKLWDLESGSCLHSIRAHKSPIWAVAIAVRQDGNIIIVSTSGDGSMRSWDGKTGKRLLSFKGHTDKVLSVFILQPLSQSPLVFSAGADKQIHVWELLTGLHIRMIEGHQDEINSVVAGAFSDMPSLKPIAAEGQVHLPTSPGADDNKSVVIVSGSRDLTVKVWDYSTGLLLFELLAHSGCVYEVSIIRARRPGPNGILTGTPIIVSCGEDATIRLWNLATGKQIKSMKWHSVSVRGIDTAAVILPDKKDNGNALRNSADDTIGLIASCGWDKTIQFHEVDQTISSGNNACCSIS